MTKSEIIGMVKTLNPSSRGLMQLSFTNFLLAESVRQILDKTKHPNHSDMELVAEIRQTITNLESVLRDQKKRRDKIKIRKLADEIQVYENTLIGMRTRLDKLKNP